MIEFKNAKPEDSKVLFELMSGLAKHHHQVESLKTNPKIIAKVLEDSYPKIEALFVYHQNEVAGYVSYYNKYSIWLGTKHLYIDDVFILKRFRGMKIGKALMHKIQEIGRHLDTDIIKWEVEIDNARAIKFYRSLGAKLHHKGMFQWKINE